MDTKVCTKCSIEKFVSEFHKSTRNGYKSRCKSCRKEDDIIWRELNKDKVIDRRVKSKDYNKEYLSKYYLKNKENIKEYNRKYYSENSEEIIFNSKKYYSENKERVLDRVHEYYYDVKDSDQFRSKKREYMRYHYSKKPYFYAHRNILKRHLRYIGCDKKSSTYNMLKYTSIDLKNHIESLFKEGMSWSNYGEWHIDHIKPISAFGKSELPHVVNSLNNLQPLWSYENLSKGGRYE